MPNMVKVYGVAGANTQFVTSSGSPFFAFFARHPDQTARPIVTLQLQCLVVNCFSGAF